MLKSPVLHLDPDKHLKQKGTISDSVLPYHKQIVMQLSQFISLTVHSTSERRLEPQVHLLCNIVIIKSVVLFCFSKY